ncbi:hypothetical protein C8Q78DRAFT_443421 [Trametes maxima]|nr:hypothetical protein C8Q78DRAFT_443421 [Trametes maxima]
MLSHHDVTYMALLVSSPKFLSISSCHPHAFSPNAHVRLHSKAFVERVPKPTSQNAAHHQGSESLMPPQASAVRRLSFTLILHIRSGSAESPPSRRKDTPSLLPRQSRARASPAQYRRYSVHQTLRSVPRPGATLTDAFYQARHAEVAATFGEVDLNETRVPSTNLTARSTRKKAASIGVVAPSWTTRGRAPSLFYLRTGKLLSISQAHGRPMSAARGALEPTPSPSSFLLYTRQAARNYSSAPPE